MKKHSLFVLFLVCLGWLLPAAAANRISEVEFAESNFSDVVRVLSELSDSNIIATPEAMKKTVTIHLKNVTVLDAVKSISRISDLWYRYDEDTNTYRIMTREEYSKDLVVRESEHIEVFRLLNANVQIVAQAIEDLFGQRVILSLGVEPGQQSMSGGSRSGGVSSRSGVRNTRSFGGTTSRSNRGASVRGGTGSSQLVDAGSQIDSNRLTQAQIEQIAELTGGAMMLGSDALQQVSVQGQPIYVTVNNEHNMIIVRTDDRTVIKSIERLVSEMDIPVPQVMLEMKILSVILGEDFNSIFNFELQPSGSNQSVQPIKLGNNPLLNTGSFIYEFLNSRLRANIEFLERNNRIKVLSNPMVLASNHREAELFIGEESLLTRGFTFNPAVVSNNIVVSPSFVETETELQEIGITLRITPRINADETVMLELEQENSTLNRGGASLPVTDGQGNVVELPIDTVNNARLTGTVMAKDGLTVAVGGLIRTSTTRDEKKVPILGEIPVIGRVFRTTLEADEETETVLLITPHIMKRPEESERIRNSDNMYYQSHNADYPDPAPFPNKFIDRQTDAKQAAPVASGSDRQQLYFEMSQYAAETVRIPEIERTRSHLYQPVRVERGPVPALFDDPRISASALASWNRGGMFVTALALTNGSTETISVDYQNINGRWLASSVESAVLSARGQPESSTYLYLVSALPFSEVMANVR